MCGSLQLRQEGERQTLLLWTAVELNELQGCGGERGERRRRAGEKGLCLHIFIAHLMTFIQMGLGLPLGLGARARARARG